MAKDKTKKYLAMHPPQQKTPPPSVPVPAPLAREAAPTVMAAILQEMKIERATQAEIYEALRERHRGDPPAWVIWDFMGDRRISANSVPSRVCLARG